MKSLLQAFGITVGIMLIYCLYAASKQSCSDVPCFLPDQIIYFMFDEAWLVGLFAFPLTLGLIFIWRRVSARQDA